MRPLTWPLVLAAAGDHREAVLKVVIDEASLAPSLGCRDGEYVRSVRHACWRRSRGEYARIEDVEENAFEDAKDRFCARVRAALVDVDENDAANVILASDRSEAVAWAIALRLDRDLDLVDVAEIETVPTVPDSVLALQIELEGFGNYRGHRKLALITGIAAGAAQANFGNVTRWCSLEDGMPLGARPLSGWRIADRDLATLRELPCTHTHLFGKYMRNDDRRVVREVFLETLARRTSQLEGNHND